MKQAWERSSVVFAGSVRVAFPNSAIGSQIIAFQADEFVKRSHKGHSRVLVYLNRSESGFWEAFGGGRTQLLDSAADDLRFLRALPGSANKTRLAGAVDLYEDAIEKGFRRVRGLSPVHVHLRSESSSIEAVTDSSGIYEVYELPPGNFRITIDIPKGLKVRFPIAAGGEGRRNWLEDLRNTEPVVRMRPGSSADVDFLLVANNQILGRVWIRPGAHERRLCATSTRRWRSQPLL